MGEYSSMLFLGAWLTYASWALGGLTPSLTIVFTAAYVVAFIILDVALDTYRAHRRLSRLEWGGEGR